MAQYPVKGINEECVNIAIDEILENLSDRGEGHLGRRRVPKDKEARDQKWVESGWELHLVGILCELEDNFSEVVDEIGLEKARSKSDILFLHFWFLDYFLIEKVLQSHLLGLRMELTNITR